MNQNDDYQFFFTYGQKVKIDYHKRTTDCVMCLSADNNFFLKFVQSNESLKIVKIVFIPHIKNIRKKLEEKSIKIRMEDPKESFYIKNNSIKRLNILAQNFDLLIQHVRQFKYSRYSWNNLMHYTLFELNIHKEKDQAFTQKDLKVILEKIQIFNKKQKQALELLQRQNEHDKFNSPDTKFDQTFNFKRQETLNDSLVSLEPNIFLDKVRKRLKEVIENQEKNLKPREIYKIFYTIVQRNELKPLYDCCIQQKNINWNDQSVIQDQIEMTKKMIRKSSFNTTPSIGKTQKNMSLKSFKNFLKYIQQEKLGEENLQKITQFFQDIRQRNLFKKKSLKEIKSITFEEFCMFMFSKKNSVLSPQKTYVYQSEEYPLSCYFINSSHNTYLVGKQFYGKSGIEGYQRAIEEGYRSVEIDIWNGKDGYPIVTHGRTFTKEHPLEQVVQFLSQIAFEKSQFPLILSLEMHCTIDQRDKVAEIFQYYFKDKLLILNSKSILEKKMLKDLKGKVILKTDSPYFDELEIQDRIVGEKYQNFLNDKLSKITSMFKEPFSQEEYQKQNLKMKKFLTKFAVSSFSNGKIKKLIASQNETKMIDFTKDHFVRVYPGITHIFSANYNPLDFWIAGIQMVCLNIQYLDENILINRSLFRKNGGRKGGYILKPQYMLQNVFNIHKLDMTQYCIDVISAQIINKCLIRQDNYLEVSFRGHPLDENLNTKKYQYEFVCNFVHPILVKKSNDKVLFKICYPEFGFFLFKIKNSKNNVEFQGCINVSLIRPGYRVLRIFDKNLFHNDQSFLFVRVTKKQFNYQKIYNNIFNYQKPLLKLFKQKNTKFFIIY